ncbi:hypothetical protein EYF80_002875 [Liparis tanakae]|uniref:Uncharacterized protein n=1 Tax=Liparis tanakae TaxID=230148 RepID=A0A4Z2JAI3_9TELE|nr:hypothetical protein EYF80_002875 [Liparis tanakae]
MSADAISRLITNTTRVMRSGMRHTRTGNQRGGGEESTEGKTAVVVERAMRIWSETHYCTLSLLARLPVWRGAMAMPAGWHCLRRRRAAILYQK